MLNTSFTVYAVGVNYAPSTIDDIQTIFTSLTINYRWIWPTLIVCWVISRVLRAIWPTGGSQAVTTALDEITRLRKLCKDANIDPGPPLVLIIDANAGRPTAVRAILAVVSPLTTAFDGIVWAVKTLTKQWYKRITGEELPDSESGVLNLKDSE